MKPAYQDYLERALTQRQSANPGYSLRAFARDLSMAPSSLSEILQRRKGLSQKKALAVAKALHLPEWQADHFCDLVTSAHGKSAIGRTRALGRLRDRARTSSLTLLHAEAQFALTSWLDLAILEVIALKDFRPDPAWIGRRLGVPVVDVQRAVRRLRRVRLLEIREGGAWVDRSPFFTSSDGLPSESIRCFHRSVLNLAHARLASDDLDRRSVKSVVFSLSRKDVPVARQILNEAIAKIVSLAETTATPRDEVLCFSGQLFSLTESETTP